MGAPPTMGDYVREAFNFRPPGMFVAPNWVFLAGVGLFATQLPALALIGLGVEMAYLLALSTNGGFRRWVERRVELTGVVDEEEVLAKSLRSLNPDAQVRFRALREACEAVLSALPDDAPVEAVVHETAGLEQLAQTHFALLRSEQGLVHLLAQADPGLQNELTGVERRLSGRGLDDALRRSLEQQRDLLQERLQGYTQARQRLDHVRAEIGRIEQQVALWREQRMLDAQGATTVSTRIDQLLGSLAPTDAWLREQRALAGDVAGAEQQRIALKRRAQGV